MQVIREFVLPGEEVPLQGNKPGFGLYVEDEKTYSAYLGIKSIKSGYLNIIPLAGRYQPEKGDRVIGKVVDLSPSNWTVDINSPYTASLHVNDLPFKVEYGDTSKFLDVGDNVLVKVYNITEAKQVWVTLKEPGLRKLEGGHIVSVSPMKVSRIIGKEGSMIKLLKDSTRCKIYVGQNGIIWIEGKPEDIMLAIKALRIIEQEAHTTGLTDRIKKYLETEQRGEI